MRIQPTSWIRAALALALGAIFACPSPTPSPTPTPTPTPDPVAPAKKDAAPEPPTPRVDRPRFDVHVHLVDDAVDQLLAALDRAGIQRAVVMSSPHLDPAHPAPRGADRFSTWREANDRLLTLSAAHGDRLLPFITADPAAVTRVELERWLEAGACGVKLYMGHHKFHPRALADPAHSELFTTLEARHVPVLLHVNTFRFEAELDALLAAYP